MNPNPLCASMFLEHGTFKPTPDLNQCDLLELRLDKEPHLSDFSLTSLRGTHPILLSLDVLITLRHSAEGGFFSESESVRLAFYLRMLNEGAKYLDLEFSAYKNNLNLYHFIPPQNLVLSAHLGTATREQLTELYNDMLNYPAATLKLVFTATDVNCALHVRHILNLAKAHHRPTVCHATGEFGEPSRILGALWGNAWTYVSLDNNPTAPGQLSLNDALHLYAIHIKSTDKPTKIFALLGFPVSQSKGKYFHNNAFVSYGFQKDAIYIHLPTTDAITFWKHWNTILSGISVTIPHKKIIAELIPNQSPEVKTLGVCNTAIYKDGKWCVYNTDVHAIKTCLNRLARESHRWLIVGTGATAESSIYALLSYGVTYFTLLGRNKTAAKNIMDKFKQARIRFVSRLAYEDSEFAGVIQTTPVGMHPNTTDIPFFDSVHWISIFMKQPVFMDVIYNPEETKLVRLAKDYHCKVILGRSVFILQAEQQLTHFLALL